MASSSKDYEAILIADPELNEEGLNQLKTHFADLVTRHGGKVQDSQLLGKRKLSYRIGKFGEGNYLQIKLQLPPASVEPLKRVAQLIEPVIRLMVVIQAALPSAAAQASVKPEGA